MLITMFILVGFGGMCIGGILGVYAGQEIAQAEAIRRGHARYFTDEWGHTEYQWLPPAKEQKPPEAT